MKYQFTTNSRVISKFFAEYTNTFLAFCELINNSIQANAKEIRIHIDQTPGDILKQPIISLIRIRDDGYGVSQTDFKKKIFEIGTDVKAGGRGVGRFSTFQIGAFLEVETIAFDQKLNKNIKTIFPLSSSELEKEELNTLDLDVEHQELEGEHDTYYQVTISKFYDESVINQEKRKKIHQNLFLENIEEAVFMRYPLEILNDKVAFIVNDTKIDKDNYVIGDVETRKETYTDLSGKSHEMHLTFINYKAVSKDIRVFLRVLNNNIRTIGYELKYTCDIPDTNSWLLYVDSELFDIDQDIFKNLLIPEIREDSKHLVDSLQGFIDKFFKEKFKEYFSFSKKLKDDPHYPYRQETASSDSKSLVFNQVAYFIEKEHQILAQRNKIRKLIYPLVDKAISHKELRPIVNQMVSLKKEHIEKFNDLLERTDLEDVIHFSEEVAKRSQFLDFLDDIIYGAPSKHVKERSQLHKIVEKNLWVFGEQYNDTPILFSDKSLKNNLIELRTKQFEYDPTEEDYNLIKLDDKNLRDITDLFFFNEKITDDQKREVMVVELKRPSCRISQKEFNQLDRYRFNIEKSGKFSQEIFFKIYLISSDFTAFGESQMGTVDKSNLYLYQRSKDKNIETYVIKWSDLIHSNRRKLSYLGNALKTKDRDVKEVFEKDYPDIEISDLASVLSCTF